MIEVHAVSVYIYIHTLRSSLQSGIGGTGSGIYQALRISHLIKEPVTTLRTLAGGGGDGGKTRTLGHRTGSRSLGTHAPRVKG